MVWPSHKLLTLGVEIVRGFEFTFTKNVSGCKGKFGSAIICQVPNWLKLIDANEVGVGIYWKEGCGDVTNNAETLLLTFIVILLLREIQLEYCRFMLCEKVTEEKENNIHSNRKQYIFFKKNFFFSIIFFKIIRIMAI